MSPVVCCKKSLQCILQRVVESLSIILLLLHGVYRVTCIRLFVSSANELLMCSVWLGSVGQSSDVLAGHDWSSNKVDETESCQQQSADTAA